MLQWTLEMLFTSKNLNTLFHQPRHVLFSLVLVEIHKPVGRTESLLKKLCFSSRFFLKPVWKGVVWTCAPTSALSCSMCWCTRLLCPDTAFVPYNSLRSSHNQSTKCGVCLRAFACQSVFKLDSNKSPGNKNRPSTDKQTECWLSPQTQEILSSL